MQRPLLLMTKNVPDPTLEHSMQARIFVRIVLMLSEQ